MRFMGVPFCLSAVLLAWCAGCLPVCSQDVLGTNPGISGTSPGVFWPKGMSLEALGPSNLYPNGEQFGLSNTSGGFGTTGSGPASAVGLAQRSVSQLVQQELNRSYTYISGLTALENAQSQLNYSLLSGALASQYKAEISKQSIPQPGSVFVRPSFSNVDAILQDRPATTDSVLKTDF